MVRSASSGCALQAGSPTIEARWTTASNRCPANRASSCAVSVMSVFENVKSRVRQQVEQRFAAEQQGVRDDDSVPAREQVAREKRADVAGSPGHQDGA